MDQFILWYGYGHVPVHFILPLVIFYYRRDRVELLLLEVANAIDLDHLLAATVFDPMRCSLTTHFLHSWQAALVYLVMCGIRPVRFFGIGALLHLAIDAPNCM